MCTAFSLYQRHFSHSLSLSTSSVHTQYQRIVRPVEINGVRGPSSEGCVISWHRGWLFSTPPWANLQRQGDPLLFRAYQPVWDRRRRKKGKEKDDCLLLVISHLYPSHSLTFLSFLTCDPPPTFVYGPSMLIFYCFCSHTHLLSLMIP